MRQVVEDNITLLEEDNALYLYINDPIEPLAVQQVALLPEEVEKLYTVCKKYLGKKVV